MKHVHSIDGERVMAGLRRVLASRTFSRSQRLRAFLKFVVETEQLGLAHQLKGYTIGIDVFSRNQTFDAGGDPLVRVQAGKLRRLLGQYYADEGKSDPLRITIPLGAYVPTYAWSTAPQAEGATGAQAAVHGLSLPERWSERCDRPARLESAAGRSAGRSGPRPPDDLPAEPPRSGGLANLPRIVIDADSRADRRVKPYVNAVLLAGLRVLGSRLLDRGETVQCHGGKPHALDFTLSVRSAGERAPLCVSLLHDSSGHVLFTQVRDPTQTATSRQLAALANQCVAETLPLAGLIYQFARLHGYSTPLMDCLDATYHYRIDNSPDRYMDARRRQNRLVHPARLSEFTTDLAALIALADGVLLPEPL